MQNLYISNRDPYKVLLSTIHMFEAGIQAMTFEKVPPHALIEDMAVQFYKTHLSAIPQRYGRVPREQLVEICLQRPDPRAH